MKNLQLSTLHLTIFLLFSFFSAGPFDLPFFRSFSKKARGTDAVVSHYNPVPCDTTYLSDLSWEGTPINGSGPVRTDQSNDNGPITIGGQVFTKGLGVHAYSSITYLLDGSYQYFRAFVGVDDESGTDGSVQFEIYADGMLVLQSPVLFNDDDPYEMVLNVEGVMELILVVNNGGDNDFFDHADWGDARLEVCYDECAPGTPCDDKDPCTINDVLDANCNCAGNSVDSDNDTVCDMLDRCPGSDDRVDAEGDGNPDACDDSPCNDTYLNELAWTGTPANGLGPIEINRSVGTVLADDGLPLTINGQTYDRGLGVHANSEITYTLNGQYEFFRSFVGVDDEIVEFGSVQFEVYGDGALLAQSPVLTFDDDAFLMVVDIKGVNELKLVVTDGGDGVDSDHGDWALPQLEVCTSYCTVGTPCDDGDPCTINDMIIETCRCAGTFEDTDQDGVCDVDDLCPGENDTYDADLDGIPDGCDDTPCTDLYLSDMNWVGKPVNGSGPVMKDLSNDGQPLTIGGQTYDRGLGVHANSELTYQFNGQFETFEAVIGLDDEVGAEGTVVFEIYADGQLIYQSDLITNNDAGISISVDITGVNEFRLVVTQADEDNFFDHANWADAKLTCKMEEEPCDIGSACDDNDPCTINDVLDTDCMCVGTPVDSTMVGVPTECFTDPEEPMEDEEEFSIPVFIPNAFSPNEDGVNDRFTVFVSEDEYIVESVYIFNRWGQMVFKAVGGDYVWDGLDRSGDRASQGVYVYRVELTSVADGSVEILTGDVTLIW